MKTKERNQMIAKEYEQGATVAELAQKYSLTIGSTKNVVLGMGASRKPCLLARNEAIKADASNGIKTKEIALKHQMSYSRTIGILQAQKNQPGEPG